jgi:hypothetical protein
MAIFRRKRKFRKKISKGKVSVIGSVDYHRRFIAILDSKRSCSGLALHDNLQRYWFYAGWTKFNN